MEATTKQDKLYWLQNGPWTIWELKPESWVLWFTIHYNYNYNYILTILYNNYNLI